MNGVQAARVKCNTLAKGNSCPVNQCSIVASRGDLARNNRTARETPAPCIVDKRSKTSVNAASTRAKRRDNLPLKRDIPCADDFGKAQRPIRKSFSVPDCLREGKIVPNRFSHRFFLRYVTRSEKFSILFFEYAHRCYITAIVSIFKTRSLEY